MGEASRESFGLNTPIGRAGQVMCFFVVMYATSTYIEISPAKWRRVSFGLQAMTARTSLDRYLPPHLLFRETLRIQRVARLCIPTVARPTRGFGGHYM